MKRRKIVKKRAPKKVRKLSLKQMLSRLDTWLCGERGRDLASVLSALRGPDRDDSYAGVKAFTTVHIRAAAFPRLAKREYTGEASARRSAMQVWTMASSYPFDADKGNLVSSHFKGHIDAAAKVLRLGLK